MLKLISPPEVEPVTVSEVKSHLRIDGSDEDTLLALYIKAAREHVETITRRALISQQWQLTLDDWWDDDYLEIPLPPLIRIDSLSYRDEAGDVNTVSSSSYVVVDDYDPGRIAWAEGVSAPTSELYPYGGVMITFTAGYGTSGDDVPEGIRQAIRLLAGFYYENREAAVVGSASTMIVQIPFAVDALLAPYRVWSF